MPTSIQVPVATPPIPLVIEPVDLVSTLRAAPANGPISSQAYNDSWREALADLASITLLLNTTLLPILNGITTEAQQSGLLATTIFSSNDENNPFFFDSTLSRFLTIGEVLLNLNNRLSGINTQAQDLAAQIIQLNSKLATTNQADLLSSIQGFSAQIRGIATTVNALTNVADANTQALALTKTARLSTTAIAANSSSTVTLTWPSAYPDNAYTASVGVSDPSGYLIVTGWSQLSGAQSGQGLSIVVKNTDTVSVREGNLHVMAKYDGQS